MNTSPTNSNQSQQSQISSGVFEVKSQLSDAYSNKTPSSISKTYSVSSTKMSSSPEPNQHLAPNRHPRASRPCEYINDPNGTILSPPKRKQVSRATYQTDRPTGVESHPQGTSKQPRGESSKAFQGSKIVVEEITEPSRQHIAVVTRETRVEVSGSEGGAYTASDTEGDGNDSDHLGKPPGECKGPYVSLIRSTREYPPGLSEKKKRRESPHDG